MLFSRALRVGLALLPVAVSLPASAQDEPALARYALSLRTSTLMSANSRKFFGAGASGIQFQMSTNALTPQFSPLAGVTTFDIETFSASSSGGKSSAISFLAVERFPIDNDPDATPFSKPWIGIGFGLSQLNVRLMNPSNTSELLLSDDQFKTSVKFLVGMPIAKKFFIEASARFYGRIFGLGPNQYSLDAGIRF